MKVKVNGGESNCQALVKRMMFLAWKACGKTAGMGWLQDRGPNQTEDQVWKSMYNKDDYPYHPDKNKPNDVYADYVMGRMMKVGFKWTSDSVDIRDGEPRSDYQAWCVKYPSYLALPCSRLLHWILASPKNSCRKFCNITQIEEI